jgi:hypothetical protein
MLRLFALTLCILSGLAGCQQPIARSAGTGLETARAKGAPAQPDPQYLLNAREGYVLSNPPPGLEVRFGSKRLRRVGWDDAGEAAGKASNDGSD